jgi:hypothetical protein
LFNVNPKDVAPVVGQDQRPEDPFLRDRHLTWAIFCVALSMVVTLIVSSGTIADYHREKRQRLNRDDDL